MNTRLSSAALKLFGMVNDNPTFVDDVTHSGSHSARLHLVRKLLDAGLVEKTRQRPVEIRLVQSAFAVNLRDALRKNPKNADLLSGLALPVLGVLATLEEDHGATVEEIALETGAHPNTVRSVLSHLMHRGLIAKSDHGRYDLAHHALEMDALGTAFVEFELDRKMPAGVGRTYQITPLIRVIEADRPLGLPLTAVSRFQEAGADVISSRIQMRLHPFRDDSVLTLEEALEDARRLNMPPRTLTAMESFLDG